MSRNNTGNPIGSKAFPDFEDNVPNLDVAVNSDQDTWRDRLGKSRLTWAGIVKAGTGDAGVIVPIVQQAAQDAASAVIAGVDGHVAAAHSAADQAEAARDAAFVNADVYPDVEAGRSAVEIGEQFSVVSYNGRMLVRYRKDSSGSSPEVARMAIAESVLGSVTISFEYGFYGTETGLKGSSNVTTSICTVDLIPARTVSIWLPDDRECRVHLYNKDRVFQTSSSFASSHTLPVDGYFSISERYVGGDIEISPGDSKAFIAIDKASDILVESTATQSFVEEVSARTLTLESMLNKFYLELDFENGTLSSDGVPRTPEGNPFTPIRLRTIERTEFIGNIVSVTTSPEQECDIYLYDEAGNFVEHLGYSDNHEDVEVNGSFNLLVRYKDQRDISPPENTVSIAKEVSGGSAETSRIRVTRDLPNGDYGTSSSSDDYISLSGRSQYAGVRHILAKVNGIYGKNPTFRVSYSGWSGQPTDPKHRLVWSLDPDGDRWLNFDNQENNDDELCWEFKNNQVFENDVIYIANMPNWTPGRYRNRIHDWTNSPLTSPTNSADNLYKVGRIEARYVPQIGKNIPAVDCYAFKVGTGPVAVALTSGVHPDECPGHYIFEGSVDAILSGDQLGSDLRNNFTFYIYPNLNAQGLFAGTPRADLQTSTDANRIWGNESIQSDLTSTYIPVWEADFGESLKVAFDYHSEPSSLPNGRGRAMWYRTDIEQETPARTAFFDELLTYGDISPNPNFTSDFTINYIMRQIGNPLLVMTIEYRHDFIHGVSHWREFGVDIMRSLVAIKDTLS